MAPLPAHPPGILRSKFYILLLLPWFLYPRSPRCRALLALGGREAAGFVCPKTFLHLLGKREGSCAVFGLQFHFNFFVFVRLSLSIQSITLAQ